MRRQESFFPLPLLFPNSRLGGGGGQWLGIRFRSFKLAGNVGITLFFISAKYRVYKRGTLPPPPSGNERNSGGLN